LISSITADTTGVLEVLNSFSAASRRNAVFVRLLATNFADLVLLCPVVVANVSNREIYLPELHATLPDGVVTFPNVVTTLPEIIT
jgi:hypothetical protein